MRSDQCSVEDLLQHSLLSLVMASMSQDREDAPLKEDEKACVQGPWLGQANCVPVSLGWSWAWTGASLAVWAEKDCLREPEV